MALIASILIRTNLKRFQFLIFGIYFCITCIPVHHNTWYCVVQPNVASHKQMCIIQKTRKCSFHTLVAKWFHNKNGPFLLWIVPQGGVPSIPNLRWVYSAITEIRTFIVYLMFKDVCTNIMIYWYLRADTDWAIWLLYMMCSIHSYFIISIIIEKQNT